MLGCMVEESNLGITAAASLGAATRNITRADLDATFNMTERPFKGGIYVEDTKKLVLPDVPGFGFIGFENEQLMGGVKHVSGFIIYENSFAGGCFKAKKLW